MGKRTKASYVIPIFAIVVVEILSRVIRGNGQELRSFGNFDWWSLSSSGSSVFKLENPAAIGDDPERGRPGQSATLVYGR